MLNEGGSIIVNETLLGRYDLSNVSIDCNIAYSNFAVYAHELAHFSLTKNTLFGILHFLTKQIVDSFAGIELNKIFRTMTDASERTQEVYAIYYELLHISSQYRRFFKSYYFHFERSPYYFKYNFSDFEWILGSQGLNGDAKLIERFSVIAMNVDITKNMYLNPWESSEKMFKVISENKSKYMPDFRFEKMLSLIYDVGISKLHKMTDCEIALAAGIEYTDFTTETVLEMLVRLEEQFDKSKISSKIVRANINNIKTNQIKLGYYLTKDDNFTSNIKQTILPECLNHKFKNFELRVLPHKEDHNIEMITLYDYKPNCLCQFTDFIQKCNYVVVCDIKETSHYLKEYDGTIQFYFDDYTIVPHNWTFSKNRRIFFILKNPYYEFKVLIENYICEEKYSFICKLNDGVFLLFVFDNANNVFYTCQSMINLDVVSADFENGFFSSPDISDLIKKDGWRDYVKILSYVSEINMSEMTVEDFVTRIIIPNL